MNTVKTDLTVRDVLVSIIIIILFDNIMLSLLNKILDLNYYVTHSIQIIAILISILYFNFIDNNFIRFINKDKPLQLHMVYAVLCCIIINFPFGIWFKSGKIQPMEYVVFMGSGMLGKLCLLVIMCILLPVVEEILFRGYIYSVLRLNFNFKIAMVLAALIFSIMHTKFSINTFIPGIIYAFVYERTNNIWSPIIVHCLNNMFWFVFVIYGLSGF